MLRLLLVRHGRTSWNVQGRVQGGGGLDEVGRAQAAALADRLRPVKLDAVYASPALRARQTAQAVARTRQMKVKQRYLLHDLDYGKLAGALLKDVEREDPALVKQWREHPHTVRFEGGESLEDLRARMAKFAKELAKQHPSGTVLAATHDSPVRAAVSLALGIEDAAHNREDLRTKLASITEFDVDGGRLILRNHNDVEHLRGIDGAA